MADKRISQLVERTTLANNDVLPIVASGATTTNKVTLQTIEDWMQSELNFGVTSVAISVPTGLTVTGSPITSTGTFIIGFAAGYSIPTNTKQGEWDQAYNDKINSVAVTGTTTKTITLTQQDGGTLSAQWSDLQPVTSVFGRTGDVVAVEGDYSLDQLSGVGITSPSSGQVLKYDGTNWVNATEQYVGTVTSVGVSVPAAFSVTGSPITTSGTITISGAGTSAQYIDGTGSLQTFPTIIAQATNLVREVYNNSGATMTKGTVVYINGGQGNLPTIAKAKADADSTSAQTYGVVQANIGNMSNGYIVVVGDLTNMDTQAYVEGTQLYLSGTTAGNYTSTKPYAPIHIVYVGIVTRSHPTQGIIAIKIQNGYEMDEIHDVSAQNPNNNDILQYKTATGLWTKTAGTTTNIAEGTNLYYTNERARQSISETITGIDYDNTTGVFSTTSGYGIPTTAKQTEWDAAYNDKINSASVSGTTTKTLTLTQQDGGTITTSWSDYDTAPVTSVFGRTGAIIAAEGDYTLTQLGDVTITTPTNGQFLKYDGTTWINAAAGTVTSVALATGTTGTDVGVTGSPITGAGTITLNIPVASATNTGKLSSTDWSTFNGKQAALNGIGFVKANGTTISYDNSTYALDSAVVHITGTETITGAKTFTAAVTKFGNGTGNAMITCDGLDNTSDIGLRIEQAGVLKWFVGMPNNVANDNFSLLRGGSNDLIYVETNGNTSFLGQIRVWKESYDAILIQPTTASPITNPIGIYVNCYPSSDATKIFAQYGGNWASPNNWGMGVKGTSDKTIYMSSSSAGVIDLTETAFELQLGAYKAVKSNRTLTINGTAYDLSADRSWTITAGVSGSGADTRVAYWTGANTLGSSNLFIWDYTNGRLGINSASPQYTTHIQSTGEANLAIETNNDGASNFSGFRRFKSRGNTSTKTTVVNGDTIVADGHYAHDGTQYRAVVSIVTQANGAVSTNDIPTIYKIRVGKNDASLLDMLSLTSAGVYRLDQLTSNGFVKTSGSNGTLSIDTTTYLSVVGGGTGTATYLPEFASGGVTLKNSPISNDVDKVNVRKDSNTITDAILQVYPVTGTNASLIVYNNSGAGAMYVGRQNSAGNSVLVGSLGAYASVVGHTGTQHLHFVTSGTSQMYVSGDGYGLIIAGAGNNLANQKLSVGGGMGVTGINLGNMASIGSLGAGCIYMPTSGGIGFRSTTGATGYAFVRGDADNGVVIDGGATTLTYGTALHLSNGGYGCWVQGSTEGATHAFIGNFKFNFVTPSSSYSPYTAAGMGIRFLSGIRFYSQNSGVNAGTFTPVERAVMDTNGDFLSTRQIASNYASQTAFYINSGNNSGGGFFNNAYNLNTSQINLMYGGNWQGAGNWGLGVKGAADTTLYFGQSSSGILQTSYNATFYVFGYVYATADITAYSDARVKTNIRPIENVIERIQKSRGILYDRTDTDTKNNIGFIAQELEVAFPELVHTDLEGKKGVKYANAVAVLFEAVKEQQKQINELKNNIS